MVADLSSDIDRQSEKIRELEGGKEEEGQIERDVEEFRQLLAGKEESIKELS